MEISLHCELFFGGGGGWRALCIITRTVLVAMDGECFSLLCGAALPRINGKGSQLF
jgi:hypothetical protein